ncbi:integrase core domain protein [Holospora obtusa F1]|uniref:Integrase core domain protein n=1 Tax=Holospora obtusa F1 TaxID=1399147 RepID=W6TDJ1_HOLOB|nr:integrase core domain protein [Holospora obtusa F1]
MFLRNIIEHYPFKITKIFTDNGSQFTYALLAEHLRPKLHPFNAICKAHKIEHKLTQFRHPWTNRIGGSFQQNYQTIYNKNILSVIIRI